MGRTSQPRGCGVRPHHEILAEHGISVERVMTDNEPGYQSHAFKQAITDPGFKHITTKPYTPRTNDKAEAVIRTLQRE